MRKLTQQAVRDWNEEGHGNTWNIFFQSMPGGGTREFESMDEIMRNARSGGRIIHEVGNLPHTHPLPPAVGKPCSIASATTSGLCITA